MSTKLHSAGCSSRSRSHCDSVRNSTVNRCAWSYAAAVQPNEVLDSSDHAADGVLRAPYPAEGCARGQVGQGVA
eukprot:693103-Alexandrium_andersonii.AAC.1